MPAPRSPKTDVQPALPARPLQRVAVEDRVLMRKPHPCGSVEWAVTRIGADIGLRCAGCGRRMMLDRDAFYRAARRILTPEPQGETDLWNPDVSQDASSEASG